MIGPILGRHLLEGRLIRYSGQIRLSPRVQLFGH